MPEIPSTVAQTTESDHRDTAHLAINNSCWRRWLTLFALKTAARFYPRRGCCYTISPNLIVKHSSRTHLSEAATMEFVAANTAVPVPRVHCSFIHNDRAYIVMDRIRGVSIAHALEVASEEEQQAILKQLRKHMDDLRAISISSNIGVRSCLGGSLLDDRLRSGERRMGPFATIPEFHSWLREGVSLQMVLERQSQGEGDDEGKWKDISAMIQSQDGSWPPPVFTHGDLNPSNVFVQNGKIVGIIDWEFAGWYPCYWEYTSSWLGEQMRPASQKLIPQFLDPHPEALQMEITRQKWWGDV